MALVALALAILLPLAWGRLLRGAAGSGNGTAFPVLHLMDANITAIQFHHDMEPLYASCLEQDMQAWPSDPLPPARLRQLLKAVRPGRDVRVMMIKAGRLYEPLSPEPWHCM